MSSFKQLAEHTEDTEEHNTFLESLKGLDFAQWNLKVGWPRPKPGKDQLPFPLPFQSKIFNALMIEDGSPKDRHVCWLGSRGLSKTETCIRILCYIATRNDDLRGSEMMIITGSRASLSYSIISRIKHLMKNANLDDSGMSYVDLNGVHIEGYPSDSLSARGKAFVSVIFVDESSWWQPSETTNVMDMVQGYWPKFNCWTLLASSPSQPGDLMDTIFKQPEEETAWHRLKMDYTYGENLIYTPQDLARIRKTSSWNREMLLRWSPKAGSTFLPGDVERAKCLYNTAPMSTERVIAVDPASNVTGIVVCEEREGDIFVLLAKEKIRATHESLSDYVYELWHQYAPISKLYIDNSAVTFVKTMRGILGERIEYMDEIKEYKAAHANYMLNCRCEPVFFSVMNKKEMLGLLKQALEEGHLKIHQTEHEKLLQFLFSCTDTELIVEKGSAGVLHDDIGDCI